MGTLKEQFHRVLSQIPTSASNVASPSVSPSATNSPFATARLSSSAAAEKNNGTSRRNDGSSAAQAPSKSGKQFPIFIIGAVALVGLYVMISRLGKGSKKGSSNGSGGSSSRKEIFDPFAAAAAMTHSGAKSYDDGYNDVHAGGHSIEDAGVDDTDETLPQPAFARQPTAAAAVPALQPQAASHASHPPPPPPSSSSFSSSSSSSSLAPAAPNRSGRARPVGAVGTTGPTAAAATTQGSTRRTVPTAAPRAKKDFTALP